MDDSGADVFFWCKFERVLEAGRGKKPFVTPKKEKNTHSQKKTWDRRHLHPKVTHIYTHTHIHREKRFRLEFRLLSLSPLVRFGSVFIFNSLPFNLQRVKKKQAFEKGSRGRPRKYKKVVFFITAGDRW
jgi:hypothetical protein